MVKICDSHVHSRISVDSSASIESMCMGAISKGISCIAFTEHYDVHPKDETRGFFNPDRFAREIADAKKTFAHQLHILKGLEFGEPYMFSEELSALQNQDYDVILGSIHWVGDLSVCSGKEVLSLCTLEELYARYYTVMLETVQCGGFDVLAHFDLPKRYLPEMMTDFPIIEDILKLLVTSGIALEINTSSLRKGLGETMPNRDILRKYADLGGSMITIGSDAHTPEAIGAEFDSVQKLLRDFPQFEVGYFEQRRFIHSGQ
jgi:histidinol-phosphatase (PHP family)